LSILGVLHKKIKVVIVNNGFVIILAGIHPYVLILLNRDHEKEQEI